MVLYPEDIKWEKLKKQIEAEQPQEDPCGNTVKLVYLGSVMNITPLGKYYTAWANSNVTEAEAEKDEEWWEDMEAAAEKHGLFVSSGEGDPTDVFIGLTVEEEEGGEACLVPKKPSRGKKR